LSWIEAAVAGLIGVPVGVLANLAYDHLKARRARRANSIRITSPRVGQPLQDPKSFGSGSVSYVVSGRLGFLPAGFKIWLLVQDFSSQRVWPQGFADAQVDYDPGSGDWNGRVNPHTVQGKVTIWAVVAPPTSQMPFNYFQRNGRKTDWAAIDGIPEECRNSHSVQCIIP
jgi:hypothetical protein